MSILIQLLAIVIFLLVFLAFKPYEIQKKKLFIFNYFFIINFFMFFIKFNNIATSYLFNLNNLLFFYVLEVVNNDLYLLFNYYFVQYTVIVAYIGTIIGLTSIFFGAVYFYFKFYKTVSFKKIKCLTIIRRQQLIKQANYR
jgi:hypothetical protein